MSENISEVTDDSFEVEVLKSGSPVLVDFWAPWCGPCRAVSPVLEDLLRDHGDKLKVCKLNVDDNQNSAAEYEVLSIPTLILFEGGEAKKRLIGALSKEKLLQEIETWLG